VSVNFTVKGCCRAGLGLLLRGAFAGIIGILGGRIVSAILVYKAGGWTAMWLELGSWPLS
jgi:hypothetical protein